LTIRAARFVEEISRLVRQVFGPATVVGRPRDPEPSCCLAVGQSSNPSEGLRIDLTSGSAEPLPLRPRPRQPGPDAFYDASPFESSNGPEDLHLETPGRRRRVDALRQADERDAERLEFVEQRDQVAEVTPEPIETPADQDIEPTSAGFGQEPIESGPAVLRTADPTIDVLDSRPARASTYWRSSWS
jgi:hypothetical protein